MLRLWSRKCIGNIRLLSTEWKEQVILGLDVAREGRELTLTEIALRHVLKMKVLGLAAIARSPIRQRSQVPLGATDANSKLFHLRSNDRRRNNFIPVLNLVG